MFTRAVFPVAHHRRKITQSPTKSSSVGPGVSPPALPVLRSVGVCMSSGADGLGRWLPLVSSAPSAYGDDGGCFFSPPKHSLLGQFLSAGRASWSHRWSWTLLDPILRGPPASLRSPRQESCWKLATGRMGRCAQQVFQKHGICRCTVVPEYTEST